MEWTNYLTDGYIFGLLETLKNQYSIISAIFIFPIARWIWKKYKKATPWEEPNTPLNGLPKFVETSKEEKGEVEMKLLSIIFLSIVFISSCATYQFPECNDKYAQKSMLVKIADKYEVCLQDVGRNIMTVSLVAIAVEPKLAVETRRAAEDIVEQLNYTITAIAFKNLVKDSFQAAILADLVILNSDYLQEFDNNNPIDSDTKTIIQTYLTEKFIPRVMVYELFKE